MEIKTFQNARFGYIRTSVTQGKPYFCLKDVCQALEINDHHQVKKRLKERGIYTIPTPYGKGGVQNALFVDEPNLYRCIFQSKKKEAVEFQDWVFEEILPNLREQSQIQSGHSKKQICLPGISTDIAELARLEEENRNLQLEVERLRKTAEPTFKTSEIAEELGMTAQELYYYLRKLHLMEWCQSTKKHILCPEIQGNGFTELVKKIYRYRDGSEKEYIYWAWTRKGRAFLIDRIKGKPVDKYFDDYAEEINEYDNQIE